MAVTRRAVGTTEHFSGGGTSPQTSAGTANITIASGDTAVLLGVTYGVQGASTTSDIAMTVTCGGVSMTAVSGTKTLDHSGTNGGGVTQWFVLQDPVTAIGSTGAKTITAVSTFTTTGTISAKMILIPVVVTGALGTITGGHATSADAVSTISSGSLTVGTGGYGIAIAANGSTQPTVNTGTSVAGVTGSGFTGSDNALALDRTSDGALIANTDSGDESQLSWVTIASGGGPTVLQGAGATTVTFGQSGLGVLAIAALAASTLTFGQTGAATSKQQALAPTTVNFTPSAVPGGGPQAGAGATTLTFGQTAASTSKQQAVAPTTVTFAPSAIPTGGPQAAAGATTLTFTPVAAGAFVASTSAALTFTPAATGVVTKAPTTAPTTVTFTPSAAPLAGGAGAGGTTVTFSASATGLSKQQATAPATLQFYPSAYFASTTTPGATGGKALTFQYALRGNALTDNPEQAQANDQRDRDLEHFLDGMSAFVGYVPGGTVIPDPLLVYVNVFNFAGMFPNGSGGGDFLVPLPNTTAVGFIEATMSGYGGFTAAGSVAMLPSLYTNALSAPSPPGGGRIIAHAETNTTANTGVWMPLPSITGLMKVPAGANPQINARLLYSTAGPTGQNCYYDFDVAVRMYAT